MIRFPLVHRGGFDATELQHRSISLRRYRIFHQKFGYGRILASDGNKLEVAFDKAGVKKVIDSFVVPA